MHPFLKGSAIFMQGGVIKRGKTWSYYFDLGKIDGKRKKKEKGGFRTKKEAEQALTATMNEYNNAGTVFEPIYIPHCKPMCMIQKKWVHSLLNFSNKSHAQKPHRK